MNPLFDRLLPLFGEEVLGALRDARVILFGLGGVGGWCAESLIRSGVGHLVIVDSDVVNETNINRQIHAMSDTLGQAKVDLMVERLLRINKEAEIIGIREKVNYRTLPSFGIDAYDYALDAIDSLSPKVDLIQTALPARTTLFSSMGASCKLDPTRVRIGSFWKVERCPLASKLRKRLRKRKVEGDFTCVWSDELLEPSGEGADRTADSDAVAASCEGLMTEKRINGSAVHVTATFGFFLSWLVFRDVMERCHKTPVERGFG